MKLINDFLQNCKKPPLIAVVGPTGSGKSALSIKIAKAIAGEVINADSKQIYRGIEITTGQILPEECDNIAHHLFSYVSPTITYSVNEHCKDALLKIKDIQSRSKIPVLVGGTGLFINALTQNFQFADNSINLSLRQNLSQKDPWQLWEELNKIDPIYASKTHYHNNLRIIRALEIFYTTGKTPSAISKSETIFDSLILMPLINDRAILYQKINNRAEFIWYNGLLNEAKALFDLQLNEKLPALTSIGLPEAFAYFRSEISEGEAITMMQKKSRNYAKRQLTWWHNDDRVVSVEYLNTK